MNLGPRRPLPRFLSGRGELLAVFGVAFAVRLLVWFEIRSMPIVRSPSLDSLEYLQWARRIASGDLTWPAPPPHGPGYPFFLALLLDLFGGSLDGVAVAQAFLGAGSCVLIALVGRRYFGRAAGSIAGLVLALQGFVAFIDVSLYSEGLLLFLLAAALWVLPNDGRRFGAGRAVAAGALVGAAALVRPTAFFFLPVAVFSLFVLAKKSSRGSAAVSRPRRIALSALTAAAAGLVVLPATLANVRATGTPMLVQGHGGFNFWIGNSPARDGLPSVRPGAGWDRLEGEALRAGAVTPGDQDRYFAAKTWREIRRAPVRWVRLVGAKLLWSVQAEEVRDPYSFAFFRREASALRFLPAFGSLFPFAALGLVACSGYSRRPWILLGAAAAWTAACGLLVASSRYRLPLVPVLSLFAAVGILELWKARTMRGRALLAPVMVLATGLGLSHVWRHAPSHNFAEEWSATGFALNHERDLAGAERAFRAAVAADPLWGPAWTGLGIVAANRGRDGEALANLETAVSLESGSFAAQLGLARVLARGGRYPEAERAYRKALEVGPREPDAVEELASLLLRVDRPRDAESLIARWKAGAPATPQMHLLLARALGSERRWPEAIAEARRAVDLDPSRGDAWLTLGMLETDRGDSPAALEAFRRAEADGADRRRVGVGRALALAQRGDRESSARELREVLAVDPDYAPAARLLAELEASRPLGSRGESPTSN
ncbi:MAG: tetratricopeptide repeat protein [Acidobacteriota bacterium]|nr:tetratricopeptide repeat protein [Acidobacteriota bacterium]